MKQITAVFRKCQWLALAASVSLIMSCERPVEPETSTGRAGSARMRVNQNITQVVVASPDFTLLEAAVVRAGLADALGTGNLTVFAPTDAAFRAAGFDENAINNASVNTLRRILLYHVIGTDRFFSDGIPERLTGITTLEGEQVQVIRDLVGSVSVNGNVVSQPDLEANNGVIHVIDQVLLPSAGNIVEVAVSNPNLSFLVAAAQRAGLVQALATGRLTVFAPTNAAFQAAGFASEAAIQAADPNFLRRVLTYHVVSDRFYTSQFGVGELTTLEGGKLTTTQSLTQPLVKGSANAQPANIRNRNIQTLNGVVHVIDQVLLPGGGPVTKSVTELVVENPEFSLLEAAVIRAGLANALTTGDLTVFAPTNAAFRAAGFDENAINSADVNTLRQILLYHVIGIDRFFFDRIPERLVGINSLQGTQLYVVREQRGVFVNGVSVIQSNVLARNGVIHVIDRVLLPPAGNTVEVAVANPNLSYLVAAVQRAGLVDAVATGRITVFAPTNAAFQAAGFPTIESVRAADPATLTRILTYHVVTERRFAAGLRTGHVQTLQGGDLAVTAGGGRVTLRGRGNTGPASVVAADVVTLNGVVHVIDQVLLP